MLWKIAAVFISAIIAIVVVFVIKEIISKRNLKFYTNQGVVSDYVPIAGALELLHSPPVPGNNPFKVFLDYFAKHENNPHGMVATNSFDSTHPTILLTDIDAIGELLLLENQCYCRVPGISHEIDGILFFHYGEQALKDKAIFAEFFKHKNILGMVQEIQKEMLGQFLKLRSEWKVDENSEFKSVDLAPVLKGCFDDVVNVVLFGEDDPKNIPLLNGIPLSIAIQNFDARQWGLNDELLHIYSMGYSTKFRLTKSSRDYYKLYSDIVEAIKSLISRREKTGKKARSNLIDMMLDWNKKCDASGKPESKYSEIQMVGTLMFFYSAGTDTSRATLTSLFFYLGQEQEAKKLVEADLLKNLLGGKWQNASKPTSSDIDWDKCEILDQFIKEGQRMKGMSTTLFYRTCMKAHKIGKIKIKKGTIVNYAPMYLHHNPKYFPNPEKYDITRFEREKAKSIPKRAFAPFGLGTRMCSGMELGNVMLKSAIFGLLSQFEVEYDPEFNPIWQVNLSVEMPSVVLRLRPRTFN